MTASTKTSEIGSQKRERAFQSAHRFRREPYVVAAMLEFGRALEVGRLGPSKAAETLLRRDPFALLLAILLDQSIGRVMTIVNGLRLLAPASFLSSSGTK